MRVAAVAAFFLPGPPSLQPKPNSATDTNKGRTSPGQKLMPQRGRNCAATQDGGYITTIWWISGSSSPNRVSREVGEGCEGRPAEISASDGSEIHRVDNYA